MRTPFNPYGGANPLIDKMIGNAYDIVKYVAKYLKEIRYVAENMEYVYVAANGNRTPFVAQAAGPTLLISLGEIAYDNVDAINVLALDNGQLFFPEANTFNFHVNVDGNIEISIVDVALQNALFKCLVTHQIPSE